MNALHPLRLLRSLAARMGEIGGMLLVIALLPALLTMVSFKNHPAINFLLLALVLLVILCVHARKKDCDGHAAMRRRRRKMMKRVSRHLADGEIAANVHNLLVLGLTDEANSEDVRQAADALLVAPPAGFDAHSIAFARDDLLATIARYGRAPTGQPTARSQLAAWREAAGPLGTAWGAMLPSATLIGLAREAGEDLLPRDHPFARKGVFA